MERMSILTHNVLADCYINNFVRDIAKAIKQKPGCITDRMIDELDKTRELPSQVRKKYSWTNRSKLLGCLPPSYFADVQCFQEVTDPASLPKQESYKSESQNGANPEDADKVVTRWKRDVFKELCPPIKTHIKGKPALIVFLEAHCDPKFALCVVNLHHPGGKKAQDQGSKYIELLQEKIEDRRQSIEERKVRVIWCGDFNCTADSQEGRSRTSALLLRGFKEVADGRSQEPTFFAHAYGFRKKKIDHIFYQEYDFEVKDYRVLGTNIHAHLIGMTLPFLVGPKASSTSQCDAISDHLPVLCELSLK